MAFEHQGLGGSGGDLQSAGQEFHPIRSGDCRTDRPGARPATLPACDVLLEFVKRLFDYLLGEDGNGNIGI